MKASIDIIIVNWNSGSQLAECIASISHHHQDLVSSVIIVDNNSSDDSLTEVEAIDSLPFRLLIVRNSENEGFGTACNRGAEHADGKYLLFLNPDTRLFAESLAVPFSFMKDPSHQNVGICGIQLVDGEGRVTRTCARFPSFLRFFVQGIGLNKLPGLRGAGVHMKDWSHLTTKRVDHVIGAFFFLRRNLFETLQGFDERFFLYFEDLDLSCRAKQKGWFSIYLTGAQIFHFGGGTSQQIKAKRLFYTLRSRLLYGCIHFPWWQKFLLFLTTLFVEPFVRTISALFCGGWADVRNTLQGYGMLYRCLPEMRCRWQKERRV